MSRAVAFTVNGTPRPQPRPRFVKGRVVSTASRGAKLWRQAVEMAARHTRAKPFTGAVEIRMAFRFAVPKTRPEYLGQPHTAKPDGDNLAKAVMDALEAVGLIANDCRVAKLTVEKMWSETAGVGVVVREMGCD